jgi:hypothetical protein
MTKNKRRPKNLKKKNVPWSEKYENNDHQRRQKQSLERKEDSEHTKTYLGKNKM